MRWWLQDRRIRFSLDRSQPRIWAALRAALGSDRLHKRGIHRCGRARAAEISKYGTDAYVCPQCGGATRFLNDDCFLQSMCSQRLARGWLRLRTLARGDSLFEKVPLHGSARQLYRFLEMAARGLSIPAAQLELSQRSRIERVF